MDTLVLEQPLIEDIMDHEKVLMLYNDHMNTFEHVISCLRKHCAHTRTQAAQCAFIVHNNGKIDIKRGTARHLKYVMEKLVEEGLDARIEELS